MQAPETTNATSSSEIEFQVSVLIPKHGNLFPSCPIDTRHISPLLFICLSTKLRTGISNFSTIAWTLEIVPTQFPRSISKSEEWELDGCSYQQAQVGQRQERVLALLATEEKKRPQGKNTFFKNSCAQ